MQVHADSCCEDEHIQCSVVCLYLNFVCQLISQPGMSEPAGDHHNFLEAVTKPADLFLPRSGTSAVSTAARWALLEGQIARLFSSRPGCSRA